MSLKEKLVKEDNYYVLKKENDMKVDARLFLNENLLEIVEEDAINQIKNVASMPGIVGEAIAMSDMHIGYGFPIGGVAAFDIEKGCITPGGIGFDINCLPPNSKILCSEGYYKKIIDFENNFIELNHNNLKLVKNKQNIISLDTKNKNCVNTNPAFFIKKKYSGKLKNIKTILGFKIKVTEDHPILTKNSMVEAKNLIQLKDYIAIEPFEGVGYDEIKENYNLIDESLFTKYIKNELYKRNLLPLTLNNENIPIITKLFGYLLGDGTIYFSGKKGFISAYGKEEDLLKIKEDFKALGFSARIYSRTRDFSVPTYYGNVEFNAKNYELHVSSNSLAKLFLALGYPLGNKTNTSYLIPDWIMNSPLWIKRLFLSGLFGAELSSPKTVSKTCFGCPVLSMNKNRKYKDNARSFMIQLIKLLDDFDIKTYKLNHSKDFYNKHGPTDRFRLMISSENSNLIKLWSKIGFSYNYKREMLSKIAILYIKSKNRTKEVRIKIATQVKKLKKIGLNLKEVKELLVSKIANDRFIERHYYENVNQRITLTFPSFNDYFEKRMGEYEKDGCFYDKILTIEEEDYNGYVYDFNVPQYHNFIADNVIVSNCGVRILTTNLKKNEIDIKKLTDSIYNKVPVGVGGESDIRLSDDDLNEVLSEGVNWAIRKGYGNEEDKENCESNGKLEGAKPSNVSHKARARGRKQLGTLGSGNHFIEIQELIEVYDNHFGLEKGNIIIMIHSGSRGLGHQVCSDYLRKIQDNYKEIFDNLPEKDLAYAPINSKIGKEYFSAMASAANFAWCNRHIMAHKVKEVIKENYNNAEIKTFYDVAHNIAKFETHLVNGKEKELLVHRKGATRAFPKNHDELSEKYKKIGQPVILPGSMGTASFILTGTEEAMNLSFGSCAHGAGRLMSRSKAKKSFNANEITNDLNKLNIYVKAASANGIVEEAPAVYKDVDLVVKSLVDSNIAKKVAKMIPLGVIKG